MLGPPTGASLQLEDSDGSRLLTLPTAAPVRTVAQWEWWNRLIGNPGGYLPTPGDVAAVHLGLPQPTVLPFGPGWLRGWLPMTLLVLVACPVSQVSLAAALTRAQRADHAGTGRNSEGRTWRADGRGAS